MHPALPGDEAGLSLIEGSLILLVLSVLTAVAAPTINNYLAEARQAKAREDVQVIADAITAFMVDTSETFFLRDGNGAAATSAPAHDSTNLVKLLVGDGDISTVVTARSAGSPPDWNSTVNNTTVGTLSDHLIDNTPSATSANAYRNASNMSVSTNFDQGTATDSDRGITFNSEFAWRGAYLKGPVDPDPWGHRYAVNVEFLAHKSGTNGPEGNVNDAWVECAGPDGEIDTRFDIDGVTPGDDDIIFVLQGGTHS